MSFQGISFFFRNIFFSFFFVCFFPPAFSVWVCVCTETYECMCNYVNDVHPSYSASISYLFAKRNKNDRQWAAWKLNLLLQQCAISTASKSNSVAFEWFGIDCLYAYTASTLRNVQWYVVICHVFILIPYTIWSIPFRSFHTNMPAVSSVCNFCRFPSVFFLLLIYCCHCNYFINHCFIILFDIRNWSNSSLLDCAVMFVFTIRLLPVSL